ncbi:hypothetical protein F5Y16DRAFT_419067 [Xylariaceae sp. FL0255]|nr:hypothetical protein F5Y16DRAFT_419067 [Xylariaceae sp. FL0255]
MQLLAASLLLASWAVGAALNPLPEGMSIRRQLPANYTLSTIKWTLPITEGGANYTFYGTVQEVFAQINDERVSQGLEPMPEPAVNNSLGISSRTNNGDTLNGRYYTSTICNVGLPGPANTYRIEQGASYLMGLKGTCENGPGPGNCGRISCSYNSAIYWCNDNPYSSSYDCSSFGNYADDAINSCTVDSQDGDHVTWGQAFDTLNFNVMVGKDSC